LSQRRKAGQVILDLKTKQEMKQMNMKNSNKRKTKPTGETPMSDHRKCLIKKLSKVPDDRLGDLDLRSSGQLSYEDTLAFLKEHESKLLLLRVYEHSGEGNIFQNEVHGVFEFDERTKVASITETGYGPFETTIRVMLSPDVPVRFCPCDDGKSRLLIGDNPLATLSPRID
jgi:hypothetical protein